MMLLALIAVAAMGCVAASLFGSHAVAAFAGLVVLVLVLWMLLRGRLLTAADEVERAVRALPEMPGGGPDVQGGIRELDGTMARLQRSSARWNKQLSAAEGERKQLEVLLESMQDAVVAVDGAGRIQWTNQRMQAMLNGPGHSGSVRVGHALVQTIRDPDVLECVRLVLEERVYRERRSTSLIPGRIFDVSVSPMPGGGAVAVLHDMTRIEQVESTQREFVANVSHELRTPLTSIAGYVETLLDGEPRLSEDGREFLGTILKNARRMTRLTEDLLVLAKVESGERKLELAAIPARQLLDDAVEMVSALAEDAGVSLDVVCETARLVMVDCDALMQVLGNLIENAVKYGTPKGAEGRVTVRAKDAGEMVEFSVRDYGSGIGLEHIERIFERFYRVDKARSVESGGTGLGLAIARHIVEEHGGRIYAESMVNEGSVFVFTLRAVE